MFENIKFQIGDLLKATLYFFTKNIFGQLTLLAGIIGLLQTLGIWTVLLNIFSIFIIKLVNSLTSSFLNLPFYLWLILILFLFFLIRQWLYLKMVSGVFYDNFKKGLGRWDFDGEGWKEEVEESKKVLSVSQSSDGGLSKQGFSWSDYQFSFDCKVIFGSVGWIVRAENRTKYFMIQLNLTDPDHPKIRPHYRVNDQEYTWIVLDEASVDLKELNLKNPIRLMEWIKVRIVIKGTDVDLYLNDEHVFHYYLPDPCLFQKDRKIINQAGEQVSLGKELVVFSFPVGKVGFRCAPPSEHAHFRNVKVKPFII